MRKYGTPEPELLQRFLKQFPQLLTPTATPLPVGAKVEEVETKRGWMDMYSGGGSATEEGWGGGGQVVGIWTEDEEELPGESRREAMEEMRNEILMEERRRVAEFFFGNISQMLEEDQVLDAILEEVTRKRREIRYVYDYRLYKVQQLEEERDEWGGNMERLEAQVMEMRLGGCEGGLEMIYNFLKNQGYHYDTRRSGVRRFHKGRAKKWVLARKNMKVENVDAIKLMEELEVAKQTIRRLEKEVAGVKGERGEVMKKMTELWEENHRLRAGTRELQMAVALRRNLDSTPAKTNAEGDLEMKDWSPDEKFSPVTPPRTKTQAVQPPPAPRKPPATKPTFKNRQGSGGETLAKTSVILEATPVTKAPSTQAKPVASKNPTTKPKVTNRQDSGDKVPAKAPVIPETTPATKAPSTKCRTANPAARNTHASRHTATNRHDSNGEVLAKAFIIHGISCQRPIAETVQDVRREGFRVTGARWLVGARRRFGKPTSSVVIYLNAEIPIYTQDGWLRVRGRKLPVEVYDFDRQWRCVW